MTTRRLSASRSSQTFRLTPRLIRPSTECASSSRCQKSRAARTRRRIEILFAGRSAFATLSACTLNETDKSHRKDRKRLHLLDTHQHLKAQTLVEPDGIEPTTSCLQSTASPNCALTPLFFEAWLARRSARPKARLRPLGFAGQASLR